MIQKHLLRANIFDINVIRVNELGDKRGVPLKASFGGHEL